MAMIYPLIKNRREDDNYIIAQVWLWKGVCCQVRMDKLAIELLEGTEEEIFIREAQLIYTHRTKRKSA